MASRSLRHALIFGAVAVATTVTFSLSTQLASAASNKSDTKDANCHALGKSGKMSKGCEDAATATTVATASKTVIAAPKAGEKASEKAADSAKAKAGEKGQPGPRVDKLADRPSGNGNGANDHANTPTPGNGKATGNPLCYNNGKGNSSPVGNAKKGDCAKQIVAKDDEKGKPSKEADKGKTPEVVKAPPTQVLGAEIEKPVTTTVAPKDAPKTVVAPKAAETPKSGVLAHTGSALARFITIAASLLALGLVIFAILKLRKSRSSINHNAPTEVTAKVSA